MTPDTQPTAFGDLTKPHHVPSCASTGEGVTVPAPTPRTDGFIASHLAAWPMWDWQDHASTYADFARTLERELTEARATLLAREGELDSMSAALAAKDAEIAMANDAAAKGTKARDIADALTQQLAAKDREIAELKDKVVSAAWEYGKQKARTEKAEAERDALRTLWTEARVVVAQCRDANCLVSYGKAQCDAVAAANAWLDKMPATMRRTIDDASNTEWQLQRVTAERDQLRAEVDQYKQDFRDQEKRIQAACRELAEVTGDRNIKRQLLEKLRAALAAAQQDTERLDWLDEHAYASGNVADGKPYQYGFLAPRSDIAAGRWIRAAIDAAREGNANKAQP